MHVAGKSCQDNWCRSLPYLSSALFKQMTWSLSSKKCERAMAGRRRRRGLKECDDLPTGFHIACCHDLIAFRPHSAWSHATTMSPPIPAFSDRDSVRAVVLMDIWPFLVQYRAAPNNGVLFPHTYIRDRHRASRLQEIKFIPGLTLSLSRDSKGNSQEF